MASRMETENSSDKTDGYQAFLLNFEEVFKGCNKDAKEDLMARLVAVSREDTEEERGSGRKEINIPSKVFSGKRAQDEAPNGITHEQKKARVDKTERPTGSGNTVQPVLEDDDDTVSGRFVYNPFPDQSNETPDENKYRCTGVRQARIRANTDSDEGDYLPTQGGTMDGNIDMNGFQILNLPAPSSGGSATPELGNPNRDPWLALYGQVMGVLIMIKASIPEDTGELNAKLQKGIFFLEKALGEKSAKEDYEGSLASSLDAMKCFWHMLSMPDYIHYLLTQGLTLEEIVSLQSKANYCILSIAKLEKMDQLYPPPPGYENDADRRRRHHHRRPPSFEEDCPPGSNRC